MYSTILARFPDLSRVFAGFPKISMVRPRILLHFQVHRLVELGLRQTGNVHRVGEI